MMENTAITIEDLIRELEKHPKDSPVLIPYGALADRECRVVAYDPLRKVVILTEDMSNG